MQTATSNSTGFPIGSWAFSPAHGESVRIRGCGDGLEPHGLSGLDSPAGDRRASSSRITVANSSPKATGLDRITYAVAAARIADALTQDVLLAPLEAGVIPLPHQLYALTRAMAGDRIRYLLADEVGLGKTIEAGLIFRELKLRGLVKRVLVVAPKGLVTQWVQEMQTHFGEEFRLLTPSEFSSWRNLTGAENIWRQFDQVVCPVDSIKPVERRRGWSREKLEAYNQERLGDLIDAGWDLIICDEAHRLGGSTEQVARYRLGKALAEAAPYLLLLSATPHQGKTASFQRIMALLDRDEFIAAGSIRREKVVPFVIRTEKRRAINDQGDPLFLPRLTKLDAGPLGREAQAPEASVRIGHRVRSPGLQPSDAAEPPVPRLPDDPDAAARHQQHASHCLGDGAPPGSAASDQPHGHRRGAARRRSGRAGQPGAVGRTAGNPAGRAGKREGGSRLLLDLARRCQAQGPDARAETLLDILYENQREENNPELKYLIFTEFVPTQNMLREFLEQHGFSVVCLNGSMDLDQRRRVQRQFAEKTRILVSTDAGGEGLNLQFAHVVINYDLPWNPMRIEQRIGRVDRIGQKLPVKAFNLIFEDSVELRVQEVLEEKLATILDEFGVDKTQDVLDSAESGAIFEKLYAQAILNPGDIEKNIDQLIQEVREQAQQEIAGRSYYGETVLDPTLAQQLSSHPLPYWVERMTTAYLRMRRRQGPAGPVQLQPGMARWQPDGAGVVPQPGCPGPGTATRQPGRRPDSSAGPAVAPCGRHRADPLRAVCEPASRGCRVLVAVADRARRPIAPGREDHPDLPPRRRTHSCCQRPGTFGTACSKISPKSNRWEPRRAPRSKRSSGVCGLKRNAKAKTHFTNSMPGINSD